MPRTSTGAFRNDPARGLKGIVLLAGSVRPGDLSRGVERSLLDLPVEAGRSVLSLWQTAAEGWASEVGLPSLPIRTVIDQTSREPAAPAPTVRIPITVEREAAEFRGTGGLLRDLAQAYSPDDLLLVGNGAQILIEPLRTLAADLFSAHASVAIIAHRDGTPSGLFLVRCSVFESVGEIGFLDFKEQLLPRLAAAGHAIRVIQREHAAGFPVRTLDGYLSGLSAYHRLKAGAPVLRDPFSEQWAPTFSIVETGAHVDPSATVHDSVILSGATLQRGAAVVRCVVCPGATVRAGQTVADRIITPERAARAGRPA